MLDGIWIKYLSQQTKHYCVFEFRSFWYIWTVAGPAGVIGPLQRPNKGGRTTKKK